MKKLLLIFVVAMYYNMCTAQVYSPFPNDSAQWSILTLYVPPYPTPTEISTIHQKLKGDTIIDGELFKKIYESSDENYFSVNQNLKCFFREDSSKNVYVKYPLGSSAYNDTTEFILYDFNLSIGDTFRTKMMDPNNNIAECEFTLLSIDSVMTTEGYKRRFALELILFGTFLYIAS